MKIQTKARQTLPSSQDILEKKADFKFFAEQVASGAIKLQRKETIIDKLSLVSDELKLLRNVPYATLVTVLKERLGLTVGEDTLRNYCQRELGFPKKSISRKPRLSK
jgi:hypothetical protein